MIIIFDTETTGLPKDYKASAEDVDKWPRIIQLAYNIYDEQNLLVKKARHLIKPDGWRLMTPDEAYADAIQRGKSPEDAEKGKNFWVNNGYSDEKLINEGVLLKEILQGYVEDRLKSHYVVGHNLSFDSKIVRAEMVRYGLNHIEFTAKKICTMMQSTKYCQIPALNGRKGVKFPTLTELHNKLFGCDFDGAHDAGSDVDATAKCFFELLKRGVITLD
jgi:DNA polymerase III epsilon subunit-like protein